MLKLRGWIMPDEEARNLIGFVDEKLHSSGLDQRHHDALVKLRSVLEDDLAQAGDKWWHEQHGSQNTQVA